MVNDDITQKALNERNLDPKVILIFFHILKVKSSLQVQKFFCKKANLNYKSKNIFLLLKGKREVYKIIFYNK